ncbi:esterase [Paractinoplanes toevensis]|uniref:Esterase n=1 Tax=Paractinoplanes toevensis TaxID=571911 RepID=A0A919T942_9ACTN|nr:esterase [Actinoplanes toevensis]
MVLLAAVAGVAGTGGPAAAIANGQNARDGAYPFAALLTMTGLPADGGGTRDSSCSGALIAPRWVITAGHCFRDGDGKRVSRPVARRTTATIGRTRLNGTGGTVVEVIAVKQSDRTDVALAELDEEVTGITPLRIATEAPTPGEVVRLAGFGLLADSDESPATRLQTGQFTVGHIGPALIETSGRAPHPDTSPCRHDSGGPYFRQPKGQSPVLVAVVSSGPSCPHTGGDDSARIDTISDWITAEITAGPGPGRWGWPVAAASVAVALVAVVLVAAVLVARRRRKPPVARAAPERYQAREYAPQRR